MTVMVCVPYYGTPDLVEKAVRSVLAQTHRDLVCVVIGDGEEPPLSQITDPRLVVYTTPENRGTYFATAVALAACDTEWFSIHASDDWSEPDHIERLVAASDGVDIVFGGSVEHHGRHAKLRPVHFDRAGLRPRHVASIATGIFRTAKVQAFGWWSHPEFRIGYDSMMVNLALRVLPWRHVAGEYGYHRVIRENSLTRNPETGLHSKVRRKASNRRAALWDQVTAAPVKDWPRLLAPAVEVEAAVTAHADQLRALLTRRLT